MARTSAKTRTPSGACTVTTIDLLSELTAEITPEMVRADDVTVRRLMRASGKSKDVVIRVLAKKIASGELTRTWLYDPDCHRMVWAYRKPTGDR